MKFQDFIKTYKKNNLEKIVYHGTNELFDKFEYRDNYRQLLFTTFPVKCQGFFFSESPHDALEYGKNLLVCKINVSNLLLDPNNEPNLSIDRLNKSKEALLAKIFSPLIEKDENGFFIDILSRKFYLKTRRSQFGMEWIYNLFSNDGIVWDVLDNEKVVNNMIKYGFDGTYVAEPNSYLGRSIFITNSNQIKIIKVIRNAELNPEEWFSADDYTISKKNGLHVFNNPLNNL